MGSSILPLFLLALISLALAGPILSPLVLHEKRNHVPADWSYSRKFPATAVLPLRFGLSQPNIQTIDEFINDVAHPDSPNYGNHWTPAQVAKTFAPSSETIQTVKNWLLENGFAAERLHVTNTKGWIELNATVDEAESLLNAEYHVYKHVNGKEHVGESLHFFQHLTRCSTVNDSLRILPPSGSCCASRRYCDADGSLQCHNLWCS